MFDKQLSRRTLLKGIGVTVSLPMLEAMMPGLAFTATTTPPVVAPKRMAFLYVPNGVNMGQWTPRTIGTNYELPRVLAPLQPVKSDIMVVSGLTCDKARANGDGPGDHARAMSSFLTGCQARKTSGSDINVGVSADQVAAQRIGSATRFASLEIGCEGGRLAGSCDSGYSCAYSNNISWRSPTTPNPKETNPRAIFDRLFGGSNGNETAQSLARRETYNLSILDFVMEDANRLMGRVGNNDRRRLDEYLTGIRELETRIARTDEPTGNNPVGMRRPFGTPRHFGDYLQVMGDLLVLAFQGDLTRVATFVFANEGSNRSYREIEVSEGHHSLSHHQGNREKLEQIAQINTFHVQQFAYLLNRLRSVREGNHNLLYNSMIVYGSGNSDGNRHNHDELPIVLAGHGGGTIQTGRHARFPRETPVTNLYLAMLQRMGAPTPSLGDSTGVLQNLG